MVTLKDVAKRAGVSIATVSYVLNGTGSVSSQVAQRVLDTVKELGYKPNRKAQAMRTGMTKSIGLMLPDLTNPFFPELAQKIELEARTKGIVVILIDSQNLSEVEDDGFAILEQHGVDGIICCPVSNQISPIVKQISCPIVLIDRPIAGFDAVHSNYYKGGELLAQYALQLGHQNVGLLSGPQTIESACQRRAGFLNHVFDQLNIAWDIEVPFSMELTSNAKKALAQNNVSLIVAGADLIAIGAMNELNDLGIKVPEDVSILGFDDIPWATVVRPKLTTIRQPIAALGAEAVDVLCRKIIDPKRPVLTSVLDITLVTRDSAGVFNSSKKNSSVNNLVHYD